MTDQRRLNAKTTAALNQHFKGLTSHTLEVSDYNAHGHAVGRQGAAGYTMPPSDAHRQDGAYIPQNIYSDGAGSAEANDTSACDYGTVDKKA
jgi:hypothetical protein